MAVDDIPRHWTAGAKARGARAEQVLRGSRRRKRMTREEIAALVAALGDIWATLQDADPADKTEVYRHLGLGLRTSHRRSW